MYIESVRLVIADEHYYTKTLEERRAILNAPNINFLCKTIIFENTAYDPKFEVIFGFIIGRVLPKVYCSDGPICGKDSYREADKGNQKVPIVKC